MFTSKLFSDADSINFKYTVFFNDTIYCLNRNFVFATVAVLEVKTLQTVQPETLDFVAPQINFLKV